MRSTHKIKLLIGEIYFIVNQCKNRILLWFEYIPQKACVINLTPNEYRWELESSVWSQELHPQEWMKANYTRS